jgi:hypothetical protein
LTLAGLALLASTLGAFAQAVDCNGLLEQINRGGQPNQNALASYQDAMRKQQYELERTQSYAQSIGCYNKPFLFFGSQPPAQCGGLQTQMQRMRDNISTLQAQARQASSGGNREELLARYNSFCRAADPRQRNTFLDRLFGSSEMPGGEPIEESGPRAGSKAVCVRTCDGGFFPLANNSRKGGAEGLEDMCRALCPNTEARVFTSAPSAEIDDAVGLDGQPYRALPNAFKYRTKYDPTCTCKPADKSWVQALADAEVLLGRSPGDIIVTQQKSEELSRAKPVAPARSQTATSAKPAPAKPATPPKPAQRNTNSSTTGAAPTAPQPASTVR